MSRSRGSSRTAARSIRGAVRCPPHRPPRRIPRRLLRGATELLRATAGICPCGAAGRSPCSHASLGRAAAGQSSRWRVLRGPRVLRDRARSLVSGRRLLVGVGHGECVQDKVAQVAGQALRLQQRRQRLCAKRVLTTQEVTVKKTQESGVDKLARTAGLALPGRPCAASDSAPDAPYYGRCKSPQCQR